jgi:tRNA1(Val) A37 N6-methylase TrmN6
MAGLKENERIDDLQYKGLRIIQNPGSFCFGTDAVLLAAFTQLKRNERAADFCTGSGIIPILLSGRGLAAHITGIEIQPDMADMARRSMELNGIANTVTIMRGDIREAFALCGGGLDVVMANPPYEKPGSGAQGVNECERIARHEIYCNIDDIAQNAAKILRTGGRLYIIYRTARLSELMLAMTKCALEPKRLRFVHPHMHQPSRYVLMECRKHAGQGTVVENPLVIYGEDNQYTPELKAIYHLDEGENLG